MRERRALSWPCCGDRSPAPSFASGIDYSGSGSRSLWTGWRSTLVIVQPATVLAWHRRGFQLYWRWKSRFRARGRPPIAWELRSLIRRMASENPTWGRRRIQAELRFLGYEVAELTIARYMRRRSSRPSPTWRAFLVTVAKWEQTIVCENVGSRVVPLSGPARASRRMLSCEHAELSSRSPGLTRSDLPRRGSARGRLHRTGFGRVDLHRSRGSGRPTREGPRRSALPLRRGRAAEDHSASFRARGSPHRLRLDFQRPSGRP